MIAFFEDVRSDRQLMELVNLNLAHRWYLSYDLDEPVPDHSSLTKIRERYGLSVFQAFFEEIVEQCIEAGLVWGEELYFDSTKVLANAAISNMIPHVSPMPATKGGAAVLGYRDHYVVDGGKARIILRALVTPASIMDNTPMLDLTNWVCERWKIKSRIAVGDSKYGTVKKHDRIRAGRHQSLCSYPRS